MQIRHRHAFVRLVHAGADQAELGHRAVARDESGMLPVAAATASRTAPTSSPGRVRKLSPLTATSSSNRSACCASVARSQSDRLAPVWRSLKRTLSTARARAGMTLLAGLPTSTLVTCRLDGSNHSGAPSSGAAVSADNARNRRCTGLSARCG